MQLFAMPDKEYGFSTVSQCLGPRAYVRGKALCSLNGRLAVQYVSFGSWRLSMLSGPSSYKELG